jgi:Xaa-Pro aminopeptidase
MRMLETTLLTGPYDWDETLIPRSEYDSRIAAVRQILRKHDLAGLIVGGTSPEHGALGYATGFVPKLGPALAFIPRDGELRLAFSGGGAMVNSAERLTFIADVRAMRDAEQEIAAWLRDGGGTRFGLWGNDAIPNDVRGAFDRAAPAPIIVLDNELDALRRRKTACEIALIRRACEILNIVMRELRDATTNGKGVRTAALAAERAGYAADAEDIRILLSRRDGGMPEPLIGTDDPRPNPLLACIAVRFAGYWAEGLAMIATRETPAHAAAEAALSAVLREVRPGVVATALSQAAQTNLAGLETHPFVAANIGNGIGVSRAEAPFLGAGDLSPLQDGDVCSLRVGARAGTADNAIASAMVRVGPTGADILWPA